MTHPSDFVVQASSLNSFMNDQAGSLIYKSLNGIRQVNSKSVYYVPSLLSLVSYSIVFLALARIRLLFRRRSFVTILRKRPADADYLDTCRIKKNTVEYDYTGAASEADAPELVEFTLELREQVIAWLRRRHPDLANKLTQA
jgi:hypothetical protein